MKRVMDEQFVSVMEEGEKQIYRRVRFHEPHLNHSWTVSAESERKEWEEVEDERAEELEQQFQRL